MFAFSQSHHWQESVRTGELFSSLPMPSTHPQRVGTLRRCQKRNVLAMHRYCHCLAYSRLASFPVEVARYVVDCEGQQGNRPDDRRARRWLLELVAGPEAPSRPCFALRKFRCHCVDPTGILFGVDRVGKYATSVVVSVQSVAMVDLSR